MVSAACGLQTVDRGGPRTGIHLVDDCFRFRDRPLRGDAEEYLPARPSPFCRNRVVDSVLCLLELDDRHLVTTGPTLPEVVRRVWTRLDDVPA